MAEVSNTPKISPAPDGVPQFAIDYAPLVYLSSKEKYKPSDISAQLANTRPQIGRANVAVLSAPLTVDNLDQLNKVGTKQGKDVYLTSNVDITTNPAWLNGVAPDAEGRTKNAVSCCIIITDKGNQTTDVFYIYFFAFNWGGVVLNNQLGDHVGDWEHNMVRFVNGEPKYVWYSQHSNGEAFQYRILKKDKSGKRPLAYCANGSHAMYATPGIHDHTIPNLNLPLPFLLVDETNAGPLYDPLLNAWYYTYHPAVSTPNPTDPKSPPTVTPASFTPFLGGTPVSWLYFQGRWGDEQYPDKDKRQKQLAGNRKYVGGPTGPEDKQLDRKNVCPDNGQQCILRGVLAP